LIERGCSIDASINLDKTADKVSIHSIQQDRDVAGIIQIKYCKKED